VSLSGSIVTYTPPLNYVGADSFTYTMRDAYFATASATMNVTVRSTNTQPSTIVSIVTQTNGDVRLTFAGIPNRTYRVQATTNLSFTNWTTISTNVAGTNGLFIYVDTQAHLLPMRYYRDVTP
jgi:hypothetical protein